MLFEGLLSIQVEKLSISLECTFGVFILLSKTALTQVLESFWTAQSQNQRALEAQPGTGLRGVLSGAASNVLNRMPLNPAMF